MSQSHLASPDVGQSESHDADSDQLNMKIPETATDSKAAKITGEPSLTGSQRIDLWYTKIEEPGGHHEEAENDDQDGSGLCEDGTLTPLHELLESIENDDDGSYKLEKQVDQWKKIINVRSPEHQDTALHMAVRKGFNKVARQLLTAGAEVNIENGKGELPLHLGCEDGNQQLVEMLLEEGADPEHADASGIYPLHSAVVHGFGATVISNLLGFKRSVINQAVGDAHWTPLNKAIYYGHEDVVDTLLEGGASLYIQDSDGWTPLMTTIKTRQYSTFHKLLRHLKKSPAERDVVNIPDDDGITPLMELVSSEPGKSINHVEYLLRMNPHINVTDKDEKTALHYAMASLAPWMETEIGGACMDVALELVSFSPVKTLMHLDKDGETAFDVAFDKCGKSQITVFQPLLHSLVERLVEGESIEEPLCWAIYRPERHTFALKLFQKKFAAENSQDLMHDQWGIVEWAIYARMPRVLQTYLRTLGLGGRTSGNERIERSISNGRALIKTLVEKVRQSSMPFAEWNSTSGANPAMDAQILRDMEDILDYLYTEKAEKPSKPLKLSKPDGRMRSSLRRFRAAIIQSSFVKFRTIQEVLYDDDSMSHMQDIAKRLEQFDYTPHVSSDNSSQTSKEPREDTRARAQFTWIHLPSTNMVWMEDMTKKILKGEGCGKSEAEKVTSFLRSSWIEIPDRTSTSRFMRPRYVVKKADIATEQDAGDENTLKDASEQGSIRTGNRSLSSEKDQGEERSMSSQETSSTPVDRDPDGTEKDKSFAVSAIYMPYLYFSTYHQSESGGQVAATTNPSYHERRLQDEIRMREELFKAYENSVIHQPTTLDEFYYQFASDEDSVIDRNSRNKDQVVTRYLLGGDIEKQRLWPLLRVGQLWIWTIDESGLPVALTTPQLLALRILNCLIEWLITSTSCATNHIRDNLVTDILGHVREEVYNGSLRSEPTSATEMSRLIVDYCIGAYDRKRSHQDERLHQAERSIHQIFSDSINEIERRQPKMFRLSYGHHGHAAHTSDTMKDIQTALSTVAKQLYYVRDVRDELNILMSIARFQCKVQSNMAGSSPKEDLSSDYVLENIKTLVQAAFTLQESDISGFQSQLANWQTSESVRQGEESVKQGKIVLIFTIVTVCSCAFDTSYTSSLIRLEGED
ncbi:hypothetical protein CEP54_009739 [Fusarium duplospermum]|uniref:Uncharacterized protein n=1 Tax=Fusarium duplospermum TaxID=1325734 RepID=A0A428PNN5_9HYPO|nr:hypothetical protein CEP54_009739 [Fusarium duplospermum]